MSQARFQKRDRDKAQKEKAALKRARRAERSEMPAADPSNDTPPVHSEGDVLAELAALHAQFDAEAISFEDFEQAKAMLLERLQVR